MINEYYYATIVECTKGESYNEEATFKVVSDGIFKYNGMTRFLTEYFVNVKDNQFYPVLDKHSCIYEGRKFIDAKAGIIPISKYLKYCHYTKMEKKDIYHLLRAYDQKQRLEKKLKNVNNKFYNYRDNAPQIKSFKTK